MMPGEITQLEVMFRDYPYSAWKHLAYAKTMALLTSLPQLRLEDPPVNARLLF
jgi:hypothetical protein